MFSTGYANHNFQNHEKSDKKMEPLKIGKIDLYHRAGRLYTYCSFRIHFEPVVTFSVAMYSLLFSEFIKNCTRTIYLSTIRREEFHNL